MKDCLGWIYSLPTNNSGVIIKYYPKWLMSCVVPAQKRNIIVKKRDYIRDVDYERNLMINSPCLLLSHSFRKPWDTFNKTKEYFQIHAIDPDIKNAIVATPYRFANVYSSGTICFGDIALDGMPSNLRQANNFFWATPFNEDNSPFFDFHAQNCDSRDHEYYDHLDKDRVHIDCWSYELKPNLAPGEICGICPCCLGECSCSCGCECCVGMCGCGCGCNLVEDFFRWVENYSTLLASKEKTIKTNLFCGRKYFGFPDKADAVFISNNQKLKDKVPNKHWRYDAQQSEFIIGIANLKNTCLNINLGGFEFDLDSKKLLPV